MGALLYLENSQMQAEIKSKIVGVRVKKDVVDMEAANQPTKSVDVDPFTLRIESRPEGRLNAISEKIKYNTSEGARKIYVIVSFMPVNGIHDGEEVTIERPVEFFIPSGQLTNEHQWITATMRNLSLAARGGYITQALRDLRKVTWDKGPVRCGVNIHGKPQFHDSEVAAIAWSLQRILFDRGFLDENGNQVSTSQFATTYASRVNAEVIEPVFGDDLAVTHARSDDVADGNSSPTVGTCPECSGDLKLMDGCPTCIEGCGYSKCG